MSHNRNMFEPKELEYKLIEYLITQTEKAIKTQQIRAAHENFMQIMEYYQNKNIPPKINNELSKLKKMLAKKRYNYLDFFPSTAAVMDNSIPKQGPCKKKLR